MSADSDRLLELLGAAKRIAREYRELSGRPLGITGEVAEYEAARLLGLELAGVRQSGYDAIRRTATGVERLQVKGRCILDRSKRGQRLGRIRLESEWDKVLLVLMDADFDATEIHEADRESIASALLRPGSRSRNERGALSISKFKSIGRLAWQRQLAADTRSQAGASRPITVVAKAPPTPRLTSSVMRLFPSRPVRYQATRLLFKADVIEPLGQRDRFQIETPEGTFEMTKADFYRVFRNVTESRSYREKGVYHYPTTPQKANQFRL